MKRLALLMLALLLGCTDGRRYVATNGPSYELIATSETLPVNLIVLAVFAVTYSASLVQAAGNGPVDGGRGALPPGVVEIITGGVPEAKVAPLLSSGRAVAVRAGAAQELVESCAELARVVTLPCSSSGPVEVGVSERAGLAGTGLPISVVFIATDGTPAAENRVRTQAANLVPNALIHTWQDRYDKDAFFLSSLEQLQRNQAKLQEAMSGALAANPFAEMARRNMELFTAAATGQGRQPKAEAAKPEPSKSELDALKAQLAELQRKLDRLG